MTLKDHIKNLYESKGWNQKEFATKLGIAQSTVATWESGKNEIGPKNRKRICELFGITPNELYGITSSSFIKPDQRLIPIFDASCGKFIDWNDGSYPMGHYPESEPTSSKDQHAFYVRAHGDSMTGRADDRRTIFDGDLLLVEPAKQINDGDVIFCRNDGKGVTIKKFKRAKDKIHLIPLNDKYDIIILKPQDKCHCFKVTEIKRKV